MVGYQADKSSINASSVNVMKCKKFFELLKLKAWVMKISLVFLIHQIESLNYHCSVKGVN